MFTNNTKMGRKTITINEDTHRELVKVGIYGESMDDIIKRLLDFYEKNRK
jgi:predicted CopG family antitoxin